MNELPRGWVASTLGELCDVVSGSTPRTTIPDYWNGDIAWITPDDLSRLRTKSIVRGARSITKSGYESCSTTLLRTGAVLYSSRAPIGYVAIATGPVCTNQGFKSFVPSGALTSDYLYWYLVYATPSIRKLGSGTTFPELSKTAAKTIDLPLPPLAEQRRIVAAIEEHFSRLDAAEESLRRASPKMAVVRAAVLDAAASHAIERWGTVCVAEVCSTVASGSTPAASHMTPDAGDIPYIKVYNLTTNGTLDFTKKPTFIDRETHLGRLARSRLRPGDVLTNIVGPPLGKVSIVPNTYAEWNTNQAVVAFRPEQDVLEFGLLALWLQSKRVMGPLLTTAKATAGQFNLNVTACRRLEIPVPPLADQRRIVAEVERRLSLVDALAAATAAALKRSAALRRSILERAFTGKLVPQDPRDEPASVLLDRIEAERAAEAGCAPHSRRKAV